MVALDPDKRRFHLIRDYVEKKYIEVQRVDSADNVADLFTKQLSQQKTEAHLEKMGLRYMTNWLSASGILLDVCPRSQSG